MISGKNANDDRGKHDVKTDSQLATYDEICELCEQLDGSDHNHGLDCDIIFAFFNVRVDSAEAELQNFHISNHPGKNRT